MFSKFKNRNPRNTELYLHVDFLSVSMSGSTMAARFFWTHICRSKGTSVPQAGCQSRSIGRGQVQDHGGRSALNQALHGGPAKAGCATCHQANHTLAITRKHTSARARAQTHTHTRGRGWTPGWRRVGRERGNAGGKNMGH